MSTKTLRELIEAKGITQQEMATALDVAQSTISMWINGERIPSLVTAKKIANYFNTTVDGIFFDNVNHETRLENQDSRYRGG